ncbi:MAG: VWA domain-containing protein [Candidatus Kuenenia sp.]|nr:VWA domain-containing protein [Candidatus Kuenenia hertensis]
MISFLNPLLLFGILGACIPVIIHLINKKKAISHKFAAIDFLLQSNKRIYVKFKLRQLILLVLRACLFAFLAMALAKPFIKSYGAGGAEAKNPTSNVIIVDNSYSMQYAEKNKSLFHSAKNTARNIVEHLTKDDKAAVIGCSLANSSVTPELEYDKEKLFTIIENLRPGYSTTHITSALDRAIELLIADEAPIKQIFILTDLARNGWDLKWFQNGQQKLRNNISGIHIVDVSEGKESGNVAITGLELHNTAFDKSGDISFKATVFNYSPDKVKNLLAQVFVDQKKATQGFFNIEANSSETKEFCFKVESGSHFGWIEIPDDNLIADNKRYFTLNEEQKLEVLLIDGDPKTNIYESETFYLEKALNPAREHVSSLKPIICSVHEVEGIMFEDFDIVFLCNVEMLPYEKVWELEKFVKDGGAVVFSLGDKVEDNYYNSSFESLLPHRLHTKRTFSENALITEEQPLHLKISGEVHPVMRVLSEMHINMLSSINFYQVFYVEPTPMAGAKTILSFSDNTPAVIERQVEKGKVVVFTSSIDRDWTDLPVKPLFVPLIQQLCRYISGSVTGDTKHETLVEKSWQFPSPYDAGNLEMTNPEGTKTLLMPQMVKNEKYFIYNETHLPGIYSFIINDTSQLRNPFFFPVNVDVSESNPEKIGEKEITALMGETNVTIRSSLSGESREVVTGEAKKTLWGVLLFLALGILLAESFISRK